MSLVIIPERPADEWSLSDWLEEIAHTRPGGAGTFSPAQCSDSIQIETTYNKVRSAILQLLGWAWADDSSPWRLHREATPVQHPWHPQLWASGATVEPFNPLGTTQDDATVKPKVAGVAFIGYGPEYTANYTRAKITLHFTNINWIQYKDSDPVWQDSYAGKEWLRSFGLASKATTLDLITAEGANDAASLWFAEGVTGGVGVGPTTGPDGTPFGGTQFVRVTKTDFKMLWRNVPTNYFAGETTLSEAKASTFLMPLAKRMEKGLGRVNSTPFPGADSPFVAGTLLFKGVEEIPYQQLLRTASGFGLGASDFYLTFEHFDPTRDDDAVTNPPDSVPLKRGHLLFPYRPTGKWYYASSGDSILRGTYGGNAVLQSMDFHDLFRHVDDPAYPIPD